MATSSRHVTSSCLLLLLLVPQMTALASPAAQQLRDWTPGVEQTNSETTTIDAEADAKNVTDRQPPEPPHARPIVPCPVDCLCKNSETVDCRGAGIRNVSNFLSNQRVTKL